MISRSTTTSIVELFMTWWGLEKLVAKGYERMNKSDEVYHSPRKDPEIRRVRSRMLSRMSTGMSTISSILLMLLLILSPIHGKDIGDGCITDGVSGECKLLSNCPSVYEELLAGKTPDTSCGFLGFEPVVCCRNSNAPAKETTPKPNTATVPIIEPSTPRPLIFDNTRGSLARAKCAENAEAVWGLELPPILILNPTPVNTSRCALKTRKLIVGGKKAEPKEFPHMAAIGFEDGENSILWLCGGSLISDKIILTAAHCLSSANWGDAKWARLGDLNLAQSTDDAQPQTIRIAESIPHPDYKSPSDYHDIAVMKLASSVTYSAWVRPACLPVDLPDVGYDGKAVATGWGRVEWAEEAGSDNLLKVTLSLVSHAICNESFFDGDGSAQLALGIVNEWQICAGEVGKDTCQGDSGGPLAIFNTVHDCMYNVIGITSVGRLCGSIIPGVYTRVYRYIPWIERAAWPEYFHNNQ